MPLNSDHITKIKEIDELTTRLNKIAKKNHDEFRYGLGLEKNGRFKFAAVETADCHEFVTGFGDTPEEAVADCKKWIQEACLNWGYKE
jgi:hypothetical protein